jgi:two-component system, OmpR family, response regulator QseB
MRHTLLIADGDAELCDLYQAFLTERGYDVETCSDGMSCLEKLSQATPDALVLDPELPGGEGAGVLAWLRAEKPAHEIPLILTITTGLPHDRAEFIDPLAATYLLKPFTLTALLEKIRTAVATKAPREPFSGRRVCSELYIG